MNQGILICMSTLFMFINHPISLVIFLVLQTATSMWMMYKTHAESWMCYIMFFIYLGGLLIIFSYVSSLVPNELTLLNTWVYAPLSVTFLFLLFSQKMQSENLNSNINILSFNFLTSALILMLVYLLLVLCFSVLMSSLMKNPLKQEIN